MLDFNDYSIVNISIDANNGLFNTTFIVPPLSPDLYILQIFSNAGILLFSHNYTITQGVRLSSDNYFVPPHYNITLIGENYYIEEGSPVFYLYNETWALNITLMVITTPLSSINKNHFQSIFNIPMNVKEGRYWINCTVYLDEWPIYNQYSMIELYVTSNVFNFSMGNDVYHVRERYSFIIQSHYPLELRIVVKDPGNNEMFSRMILSQDWNLVENRYYYSVNNRVNDYGHSRLLYPEENIGAWAWEVFDAKTNVISSGFFQVRHSVEFEINYRLENNILPMIQLLRDSFSPFKNMPIVMKENFENMNANLIYISNDLNNCIAFLNQFNYGTLSKAYDKYSDDLTLLDLNNITDPLHDFEYSYLKVKNTFNNISLMMSDIDVRQVSETDYIDYYILCVISIVTACISLISVLIIYGVLEIHIPPTNDV